ncbi:MAG: caspase family protein [Planctomycetaceae bacterium]
MNQTLQALLVGINDYVAGFIPDLKGCVNDIRLIESVLKKRFDVPPNQLRILLDSEATHLGIKKAFREHLIEPAKAWAAAGKPEPAPVFLFHFSGHGSQAKDMTGTKPNGLIETIVPHDSRVEGVFDIKDWELGELLKELGQYTDNTTVILDCCHSGSGTRDTELSTRQCPPDMRDQPAPPPSTIKAGTRSAATAIEDETPDNHVLFAACSNTQVAREHKDQCGSETVVYGAMTFALAGELNRLASEPISCRDFHKRVANQIWQWFPQQTPQCEGTRDRLLFSGIRPQRELWITVTKVEGNECWIDAGSVHGMDKGVELEVYPANTSKVTEATKPIGNITIESPDATSSRCIIQPGGEAPVYARLKPLAVTQTDLKRTVCIEVDDEKMRTAIKQRLSEADMADFVKVTDDKSAHFLITAQGDSVSIVDLESGLPANNLESLAAALRKWTKYKNALAIQNNSPETALSGSASVKLVHVKGPAIDDSNEASPAITEGTQVRFEFTNSGTVPLYFSVLSFGYDGSVGPVWPTRAGEHIAINPGNSVKTGAFQLGFGPNEKRTEVQEFVKLFATRSETEFDMLHMNARGKQPGTRSTPSSPLGKLLQQANMGSGTRLLQPVEVEETEDWTAATLSYRLVRK